MTETHQDHLSAADFPSATVHAEQYNPITPPGLVETQIWPIENITPYENNPRRIPEQAIDAVAKSIELFGWQQPIVVDSDGVIVVGHTRRLAALRLGLSRVPVHVTSLPEEKVRQYRLVDNRTSELTGWNHNALVLELREFEQELLTTYFPEIDLDVELVSKVAEPSQGDLDWANEKATTVQAAAAESLHTTDVECPACYKVFTVRTRSLPGMDTNQVRDLIEGE